MPSPLQKAPRGLLSLFSLKDLGRNPSTYGDTVIPMNEVTDHYLSVELQRTVGGPTLVQNNGDTVAVLVPQGQIWRVRSVDAVISPIAADSAPDGVGLSIGIALIGLSASTLASLQLPPKGSAYAASRSFRVSTGWLARPLLAPPGASILLFNDTTWAGTVNAAMTVLFEPLDP